MTRSLKPEWLAESLSDEVQPEEDLDTRWWSIFAALADGRVAALEALYDLASSDVYRLALWRTGSREDAEDVVQDVFVRVAEKSRELGSVRRPRSWLLTVSRRAAIDCCRRRARRDADPVEEVPFLVAATDDPERIADAATVSRLVGLLPAKQREVLLLHHFADCTYAEIGRITGVPTFTAASRHRLAVAKLRRLLENNHETTS